MRRSWIALRLALAVVSVALLAVSSRAEASSITNSTGLVAPQHTITFSEVPLADGTVLTSQYAALGVTFAGLYVDSDFVIFSGASNYPACSVGCGITGPFDIFFSSPVSAAALRVFTVTGTTGFQALLNGTLVDSFAAQTVLLTSPPFTPAFFGFQGVTFNQIHVIPVGGTAGANIDNIQFNVVPTAVPEPASLLLLATGLTAVAIRVRARRGSRKD